MPITAAHKPIGILLEEYHGMQVRLYRKSRMGKQWNQAVRSIVEVLNTERTCGQVDPKYIVDWLISSTTEDIFSMVVGVAEGMDLAIPYMGCVGFIVCSDDADGNVKLSLDVLCAPQIKVTVPVPEPEQRGRSGSETRQKRGRGQSAEQELSLGIGVMLMANIVKHYKNENRDLYLHALSNDLVAYYGRFGFVLAPDGSGCDYLEGDYGAARLRLFALSTKKHRDWLRKTVANRAGAGSKYTTDAFMDKFYFSPMMKKRKEFFLHDQGYYMMLCFEQAQYLDAIPDPAASLREKDLPDAFWEHYHWVVNPDEVDRYLEQAKE